MNGRWRFWLLVLAIGIAMAAQSALPPNDYAISPDLPLPNPLWKTLLLLEGPFMPYRQGIGLYLLSMVLVIVAFGSQNTASLPGRLRNFKFHLPEAEPETDPANQSTVAASMQQWRLTVTLSGTPQDWLATWWPRLALAVASGLAVVVFLLFKPEGGQSNPGLALWMIALYLLLAPTATHDWLPPSGPRPLTPLLVLLPVSALLTLASAQFLWVGKGNEGMVFWGLGAAFLIVLYVQGRPKVSSQNAQKPSVPLWIEVSVFVGLIALATYFRLAHATGLAPGVNNDSAEAGRVAISYAMGNLPYSPFSTIGWGFESLFLYYVALWTQFVQPAYVAIRIAAATIGVATVAAVYWFGRRIGGVPLGWLSAALAAMSGIYIVFSGTGLRLILQPLFEVTAVLFFWQGFEQGRTRNFLLGGLCLGLALNTHISSRPDPVLIAVFAVFLLILAVKRRRLFLKQFTGPLIAAALATFITAAPLVGYATGNWVNYASRADFVFVGHRMTDMDARYPGSYWSPLVRNVIVGSMVFNQRGNGNDFYVEDPALDFPVTFLLPLAVAFALRHWRKPLPFLLLTWFGMGVVTGFLSEPNANRTVAALLPAYIMIALFLIACVKLATTLYGGWMKLIAVSAVGLTIISAGLFTFRDYVGPHYRYRWGYAEEATAIGAFTSSLLEGDKNDVYVTDAYYVTDVVRLLTYRPGEEPLLQPYPYQKFDMAQALAGQFPGNKPVTVVLGSWREEEWTRAALLERYPGSRADPIPPIDTPWKSGAPAGYVVTIPLESLGSANQLHRGYVTKFYQTSGWQGEPYVSYVDPFFAFPNESPYVPFSASWEGFLQIGQPGDYGFRFITTNRARLLIDGSPLIVLDTFDINSANERHEAEAHVSLEPGTHSIQILYDYEGGDRQIQLLWSTPERQDFDWIPTELITPTASGT